MANFERGEGSSAERTDLGRRSLHGSSPPYPPHTRASREDRLPQDVLASEQSFWYFVENTYNYPAWQEAASRPWFSVDHLGSDQRRALWTLIQRIVQDFDDEPEQDRRLEDLRRTYGPET